MLSKATRAQLHRDIQTALHRTTIFNTRELHTAVWPALMRAAKDLDPWTPEQVAALTRWRAGLSVTQRTCLDLKAAGLKSPEIAEAVGISRNAVLNTLTAVYAEGCHVRPLPTYPVSPTDSRP